MIRDVKITARLPQGCLCDFQTNTRAECVLDLETLDAVRRNHWAPGTCIVFSHIGHIPALHKQNGQYLFLDPYMDNNRMGLRHGRFTMRQMFQAFCRGTPRERYQWGMPIHLCVAFGLRNAK